MSQREPRDAAAVVRDLRRRLGKKGTRDEWSSALLAAAMDLGFVGVGIWIPGADGRLRCRLFASSIAMEVFEEQTKQIAFAPGEGMPGRTWLHNAPEWIPSVIKDDNFPRLRGAIRDLIRAVVAFPVLVEERPVAIAEMYSRQVLQPDERITGILAEMGKALGESPLIPALIASAG